MQLLISLFSCSSACILTTDARNGRRSSNSAFRKKQVLDSAELCSHGVSESRVLQRTEVEDRIIAGLKTLNRHVEAMFPDLTAG